MISPSDSQYTCKRCGELFQFCDCDTEEAIKAREAREEEETEREIDAMEDKYSDEE